MKALLSFIVTNLAIFVLTTSFLAWAVDASLLQPDKLLPALEKSGTSEAIAEAIPRLIVAEDGQGDVVTDLVTQKITEVTTEEYVNEKLKGVVISITTYIKEGEPEPRLDLTDLPDKLGMTGVEVPPEIAKNTNQPISLVEPNKENPLTGLRKGYQTLQLVKIGGLIVGLLLLVIDWFLAGRGRKAIRFTAIFLSLAFWSGVYYFVISYIPGLVVGRFDRSPQGAAMEKIATSILDAISLLLAGYFKTFALTCLALGVICLVLHFVLKTKNKLSPSDSAPKPSAPPSVKPTQASTLPVRRTVSTSMQPRNTKK